MWYIVVAVRSPVAAVKRVRVGKQRRPTESTRVTMTSPSRRPGCRTMAATRGFYPISWGVRHAMIGSTQGPTETPTFECCCHALEKYCKRIGVAMPLFYIDHVTSGVNIIIIWGRGELVIKCLIYTQKKCFMVDILYLYIIDRTNSENLSESMIWAM